MQPTSLFKELHRQKELLLLGNVWDVQSARVYEKLNFKAIGTSSAAVAATMGYNDGELMSFEEYFFIIKRIKDCTTLPFTVDLEAGYGNTDAEIIKNIKRLYDLGVAGINIEDSVPKKSGREIASMNDFTKKLSRITNQLRTDQNPIFINVRCDAFLLNLPNPREEALKRIEAYEKAGADGIFLPCITDIEDIKAAVAATSLPLNVMCMPHLPDFNILKSAGVKRISMGNFVNASVYKKMEEMIESVLQEQRFSPLFRTSNAIA
jgi:2-methylisocitrate lyase-like PEP mutase family enzyme